MVIIRKARANNIRCYTFFYRGSDGVAHHAELWDIGEILGKEKDLE